MPFLLAIADLTHPLLKNRSSVGIIGCFALFLYILQTVDSSCPFLGKSSSMNTAICCYRCSGCTQISPRVNRIAILNLDHIFSSFGSYGGICLLRQSVQGGYNYFQSHACCFEKYHYFSDYCALTTTILNCRVSRSYTAVVCTSTCFILNLTTVCRELLQKQCCNNCPRRVL